MPKLMAGAERALQSLGAKALPPTSLIGVSVFDPDFLIEIEATAVLD